MNTSWHLPAEAKSSQWNTMIITEHFMNTQADGQLDGLMTLKSVSVDAQKPHVLYVKTFQKSTPIKKHSSWFIQLSVLEDGYRWAKRLTKLMNWGQLKVTAFYTIAVIMQASLSKTWASQKCWVITVIGPMRLDRRAIRIPKIHWHALYLIPSCEASIYISYMIFHSVIPPCLKVHSHFRWNLWSTTK